MRDPRGAVEIQPPLHDVKLFRFEGLGYRSPRAVVLVALRDRFGDEAMTGNGGPVILDGGADNESVFLAEGDLSVLETESVAYE
jgi:hypothetical protein